MKQRFEFSAKQVTQMAQFVAELVKQGVTYEVFNYAGGDGWGITLTGGF